MKPVRQVIGTLCLALGVTLLSACGDGADDRAVDDLALATDLPAAGSAVSGAGLATRIESALRDAESFTLTVQSRMIQGERAEASEVITRVAYDQGSVAYHSRLDDGRVTELVVLDGGAEAFVKSPADDVPEWLPVEQTSSNAMVRGQAANLAARRYDPGADSLMYVRVVPEFTVVAAQTAEGSGGHVRGDLPVSAVQELLGLTGRASQEQLDALGDCGVEVYLETTFRPSRVDFSCDLSEADLQITSSSTTAYADYGEVTVTRPLTSA